MSQPPITVRVYEPFTFADQPGRPGGVRWAWVTWLIDDSGRRCVGVSEVE